MSWGFLRSGDRTRTCDLWVMSPTSYQLLHPAVFTILVHKNSPIPLNNQITCQPIRFLVNEACIPILIDFVRAQFYTLPGAEHAFSFAISAHFVLCRAAIFES